MEKKLEKIVELFKEIKETEGTNEKIELLKKFESKESFKRILRFRFSPQILTNISVGKIKEVPKGSYPNYKKISNIEEYMDYLEYECTGKHEHIYTIQVYIAKQTPEVAEFLRGLAIKKLSIGVNVGGVNKAFPGMIPTFKPMLAHKLADHEKHLVGKIIYVTLKMDGNRAIIFKDHGHIMAFTRSGKPINDLVEIQKASIMLKDGYAYDGELIIEKPKGSKMTSTARLNMTNTIVRSDEEKTGLIYYIFDMMPIEEFNLGKSKDTYEKRRAKLDKIKSNKFIKVLEVLYKGEMNEEVYELFREYVKNGEEGLMVNTADGHYVGKRTKDILKIKQFYTMDLKITDVIEGTGNAKGRAESIVVDFKGHKVSPGMGKGVNNAMKKDLLINKDKYIGKIAMISYKDVTHDKKGKESLNLPKFLSIREDKKDVSYS